MSTGHLLQLPASLSPDGLDALSELSLVLAKVRTGIQSSPADPPAAAAAAAAEGQQLSFKDVPGATDGLKHKVQHARAQVKALPDMDRSVEDQNKEISELEMRIAKQKSLLERLREAGTQFGKDADKMDM